MTDRPASWRMPSRKQIEKMAAALRRKALAAPALAPDDDLPPEYWQALLEDAGSDVELSTSSMIALQLTEIPQHPTHLLISNCHRL